MQNVQNGVQFLQALWGTPATIMLAYCALAAIALLAHAFTTDHSNGKWKMDLVRTAGLFSIPLIVGALVVWGWGVAAPALNWNGGH